MLLFEKHASRAQVAGYSTRTSFQHGAQHHIDRESSGSLECLVVGNLCWREYPRFTFCFRETPDCPLTTCLLHKLPYY